MYRRLIVAAGSLLGLGALASASACSTDDGGTSVPAEPDPRPPTPPEWDRPIARPDEATAAAARDACKFARGAMPDETLAAGVPTGKDMPIETIVVLMKENRSFDHYFGRFGKYAGRTDVESATDSSSNPSKIGPDANATYPWARAQHNCFLDTNHEWSGTHTQYNDGKMNGFVQTNQGESEVMPNPPPALGDGVRAMTWYDERTLPYYYALAKSFGIGDHYFCSLLGPTWPNRMFLFAGTSFGFTENRLFPDLTAYPFPQNDIVVLDELDKRHVDWKLYSSGGPSGVTVVLGVATPLRYNRDTLFTIEDFYRDAAEGKLPPVVFLDPDFTKTGSPDGDDEHPPANVQVGQQWTSKVVSALMKSPQWGKLALFITYDEHGGVYDHLPPPKACVPDDKPPSGKGGARVEGAFDRFGMRVPFLVVSPYAKRGYVGHGVYDHTSILRFIQAKHRLPALSARDANALVPTEFFDFQSPPNLTIPDLPEATVDPAEHAYCTQTFAR
jgi:phospholipase C